MARNDNDITRHVGIFLSNYENVNKVIGLDTERSVVGGDRDYPPKSKLVFLQLCDGQNCLIIPLPYVNGNKLPVSLTNFLNLPDFTFMGFGMDKSLEMLKSECGLTCKYAVEVGPLSWASFRKISEIKFKYTHYLSLRNPASAINEDWGSGSLSLNQIQHAATNAYLAFNVGKLIIANMY